MDQDHEFSCSLLQASPPTDVDLLDPNPETSTLRNLSMRPFPVTDLDSSGLPDPGRAGQKVFV